MKIKVDLNIVNVGKDSQIKLLKALWKFYSDAANIVMADTTGEFNQKTYMCAIRLYRRANRTWEKMTALKEKP